MPYKLALKGTRGDRFSWALPLTYPGGVAYTTVQAQAIKAAYPVIEMQVRQAATDTGPPLISATAAAGELSIEVNYPQADGTLTTAFVWSIPASKCQAVITDAVYDIQFRSGPGADPETWIGGAFNLEQDVTP